MAKLTRKLWVGIGAATIVVPVCGRPRAKPSTSATTRTSAAGKGAPTTHAGRRGLSTDGGPRDTRIRIYRDIALMRGHLLVEDELIELGRWDESLPHFLHPTEELYGLMERYIKLHNMTPFDRQLKAQGQAVKAKNKAAYLQAAHVVDERLTGALNGFKRFMLGAPFSSYTVRTIVEVLKVAQAEYEASIEGGRFTKPVEYQDSRGFVLYAERLLKSQEGDLKRIDALRWEQLSTLLDQLKAAWPAPMPPEEPVVTAEVVASRVEAFESAAKRFF
jgi:hypothetical protein